MAPVVNWSALLVCLVTSSPAIAQQAMDPPLTRVRSWTLADRDLITSHERPPAYRMRIEMGVVSGTMDRALASSEEIQHAVTDISGRLGGMHETFEHTHQGIAEIHYSATALGSTARALKCGLSVFRT